LKLFGEWGESGKGRIVKASEFKYDIFEYCTKFCKYHNVPPPRTTIKKRRKTYSLKKENHQ
jgi:hypothetical protein